MKSYIPLITGSILAVALGFAGLYVLSVGFLIGGFLIWAWSQFNRVLAQDGDQDAPQFGHDINQLRQQISSLRLRVDMLQQRPSDNVGPFGR